MGASVFFLLVLFTILPLRGVEALEGASLLFLLVFFSILPVLGVEAPEGAPFLVPQRPSSHARLRQR